MMMDLHHLSVMPQEVLQLLQPQPGGIYVDGTVGGGGHARLILEATEPEGRLIGFDRDAETLERARRALADFGDRVVLFQQNFSDAPRRLADLGIGEVDGMLLDLGVSSFQLDSPERGFSFRFDGPLDMRMESETDETAADLLARLDAEELKKIFREFGEERFAGRIARRIVQRREEQPLTRTTELAELVAAVVPPSRDRERIHPATRVFQALRIAVNHELDHVAQGIEAGIKLLAPGGRLVVISFHSLEDRIVKRAFREAATGCICPPRLPICQCNHQPQVELLNRKALRPQQNEMERNPRARSAVLRGVRKL